MTSWIRWWGLGTFVAIVLLWWLFIDLIIEKSIEFAGTQAVGAKVELDSADLSLSPTQLTLSGLQVTNPEEPMQNLVQGERIHLQLDGLSLLRRQFIAEDMAINGLQFYTARSSSGAIDGRLFSFGDKGESDSSGFELPGLTLPDTDAMVAAEKARLQGEINAIQEEITSLETQWQERINTLPDEDTVNGYKERWETLKDANALQKLAGVRELKKDIDKDLATIDELKAALKTDRARLAELIAQAASLPKREAQRMLANVGLDQGFDGMIRTLLGDKVSIWLQRGLTLYRQSAGRLGSGQEKAEEDSAPVREQGQNLRFAKNEALPDFLIKHAAIDGVAPIAGQQIRFQGDIRDITNEQALWGKPLTLLINGSADSGASLKVDGSLDHRQQTRDQINFDLQKLAMESLSLSSNEQLPVTLEKGLANISGQLALNGEDIDAQVNSLIRQAAFQVAETAGNQTTQALARALSQVSRFDLDVSVDGTLDRPELGLKSNLDRILGDAVGAEFKAKLAEKQGELQEKLAAELGPQLSSLEGQSSALDQYGDLIGQRRESLKDLMNDLR